VLDSPFWQPLSRSSLVFLLVLDPLLHAPCISSSSHYFLYAIRVLRYFVRSLWSVFFFIVIGLLGQFWLHLGFTGHQRWITVLCLLLQCKMRSLIDRAWKPVWNQYCCSVLIFLCSCWIFQTVCCSFWSVTCFIIFICLVVVSKQKLHCYSNRVPHFVFVFHDLEMFVTLMLR